MYPIFLYQILVLYQLSVSFTCRFDTAPASQVSEPSKSEELKRKIKGKLEHLGGCLS